MLPAESSEIRTRVKQALVRARTPGFHFPGHFLDLQWGAVAPECSSLSLPDGPHLRNGDGDIDLLALCVMADVSFGVAMRSADATTDRLSTVYLQLQFTGTPARGDLRAESRLHDISNDTSLQQRLASASLFSGAGLVCHGTSTFLKTPSNAALGRLPWQREGESGGQQLDEQTASDAERETLRRCDQQLASAADNFLERFWLGPAWDAQKGFEISTGGHVGNRVGHVQGGLLLGIAARAGCAAAPAGTRLGNISAWYVSPGQGTLRTRSEVLHRGRNTALVQSVILNDDGTSALTAVTQHLFLAAAT